MKRQIAGWASACLGAWLVGPGIARADDCASHDCAESRCQPLATRIKDLWRRHFARCDCPEPPLGSTVHAAAEAMKASHLAATLIFHRYDFYNDGEHDAQLNTAGMRHLERLAIELAHSNRPVIVEEGPMQPTPALQERQAALDEQRRLTVFHQLVERKVPITAERVVVGRPSVPGLPGADALLIQATQQERTRQAGPAVSGGLGGSAGGSSSTSSQSGGSSGSSGGAR